MKPAVSALNDWLKTIIVHKSFNDLRIYKSDSHFATIELTWERQYNYATNNYEFTKTAIIILAVEKINDKLTNVVKFYMTIPTGFVDFSISDDFRAQYSNITLKNLIDFVDFFRNMYRKEHLSQLYNIPNYHNMGFTQDYKPFKDGFEQYFKNHQKEYNKFLEYRDILFSYLEKKSKINSKKKDIKKDFVKG